MSDRIKLMTASLSFMMLPYRLELITGLPGMAAIMSLLANPVCNRFREISSSLSSCIG